LQLMEFFAKESIDIMESFYIKSEFSKFDPHVGETLCQIRAYRNLWLAFDNSSSITSDKLEELAKIKVIYHFVKQSISNFRMLIANKSSKYNKELDGHEELEAFLKRNNLLFDISKNLFFLITSRFLTIFSIKDANNSPIAIDFEKLINELKIAKSFARRMVRNFQENLAQISCDFIINLLHELPELRKIKQILPYLQVVDEQNRKIFPCYEVTKILLTHLWKNKRQVFVIVHRYLHNKEVDKIPMLFIPKMNNYDFELYSGSYQQINLLNPFFIIRGMILYDNSDSIESPIEFITRFTRLGITNILLANMAKHPQFSAKELDFISDNPYKFFLHDQASLPAGFEGRVVQNVPINARSEAKYAVIELEAELLAMKQLARQEGCCIESPKLFFVKHIYCDTLKNQLSKNDFLNILHGISELSY